MDPGSVGADDAGSPTAMINSHSAQKNVEMVMCQKACISLLLSDTLTAMLFSKFKFRPVTLGPSAAKVPPLINKGPVFNVQSRLSMACV